MKNEKLQNFTHFLQSVAIYIIIFLNLVSGRMYVAGFDKILLNPDEY